MVGKNAEISVTTRSKALPAKQEEFRLSKETIAALIGLIKQHCKRVVMDATGKKDVLLFIEIFELLSRQIEGERIDWFLDLVPILIGVVEKGKFLGFYAIEKFKTSFW